MAIRGGRSIERALRPLISRIAMMMARAVLTRTDDSQGIQLAQFGVLDKETRERVERFQNYGFTSRPFAGAEGLVVFVGGNRDHGICIALDDRRWRLKNLAEGEVAAYDDLGKTIILRRDGRIELRGPELDVLVTGDATISAPTGTLTLNGATVDIAATVALNLTAPAINLAASATLGISAPTADIQGMGDYKGHQHGGVEPGVNNTGPVV